MDNASDERRILVREYRAEDLSGFPPLCAQLGYPTGLSELAERLGEIIADRKQAIFVARAEDGQVAGWVHIFTQVLVVAGLRAELGGLVVGIGFRRRGVGRRLMEQVEIWAREKGCQEMVVRSNVQRAEAHDFYPGLGYRPVKQQLIYRKSL